MPTRRDWLTGATMGAISGIAALAPRHGAQAQQDNKIFEIAASRADLAKVGEVDHAYVLGFFRPFDGGGHWLRRVAQATDELLPGQLEAGGVWEIDEPMPSLKMYGAGLRGGDDRQAIQQAFDHLARLGGGTITADGDTVFHLSAVDYRRMDGSVFGACSIMCRDNVHLIGPKSAIFRLIDGQTGPGAFFRIFASDDMTGLANVELRGFSVDGNRAAQVRSEQCSNILLECSNNVAVREISSFDANGTGLMLRGQKGRVCKNIVIERCDISECNNIGIQCSHFDGLSICDNRVKNTGNNAIDVYGDDGTERPDSANFIISRNQISGGLVGVFLETVRDGQVFSNVIQAAASAGWMVNRIHGAPSGLLIYCNTVRKTPRGGWFSGDMAPTVAAFRNDIENFTEAGIDLGAGGNVSFIDLSDNYFVPATDRTPIFRTNKADRATRAAFISGSGNRIHFVGRYDGAFAMMRLASQHVAVDIRDWIGIVGNVGPESGRQPSGAEMSIPCIGDGPASLVIVARREGIGVSLWRLTWARSGGSLLIDREPPHILSGNDPIADLSVKDGNILVSLKSPETLCQWKNTNLF
jgi:hypothetical protein